VTHSVGKRSVITVLKSPRFILKNLFDEVSLDSDSVKNTSSDDSAEKNLSQISAVKELSDDLTPRQKDVINRRYYEDQTLEEVSKVFNVKRERIRQIQVKALRMMRFRSIELGYGRESHTWPWLFKAGQKVRDLWED